MSIKVREEGSKVFFQELNLFMLLSLFTGSFSILIIFQNIKIFLSFLLGGALAYLNFVTLKKEGIELLYKVYTNVMNCLERPYQKERTLFLIKAYLRLLALGIIFYFLIRYIKLHPVFLILGFTLVYMQIFVVIFRFWLKKRENF
ncbi:MAG: hypothetical protein ACP5HI_00110 [Caldimicrobium sp.]